MKGLGAALAIAVSLFGCTTPARISAREVQASAPTTHSGASSYVAPGVALLVGIINLCWNAYNSRETKRVGRKAQQTARKMGALNPYRQDVLARLKEMQAITSELVGLPRSPDYKAAFRPAQQRLISSYSHLTHILQMMGLDPEVDGSDWSTCGGDCYDRYLECCNELLLTDISDDAHGAAKTRLIGVAAELQGAVLKKFSLAITGAH